MQNIFTYILNLSLLWKCHFFSHMVAHLSCSLGFWELILLMGSSLGIRISQLTWKSLGSSDGEMYGVEGLTAFKEEKTVVKYSVCQCQLCTSSHIFMEAPTGSCNICRNQLISLQEVAEEEHVLLPLFSLQCFVLSVKWLFSARVDWTRLVASSGIWLSASSCPG